MSKDKKHWQKNASIFSDNAEEYDSWFDKGLLFEIEKSAIMSLSIPDTSPKLEIGVGPGRFARELNIEFGIDPALEALRLAKSRNIKGCVAIGEHIPFRTNSITVVYLLFTLCFLENPAQIIKECHRILKHDGVLIIGFIPKNSLWGKKLIKQKHENHTFYKYANFYTASEVVSLLQDNDFTITQSSSTLFQPPGGVDIIEKPKPGINEKAGFSVITATT